jgi:hypothetical protein
LRSPVAKIAIITLAVAAVVAGLLVYSMLQQTRVSCEVCITFRGATQCRTALGPTRENAVETATNNACAFLASGMTDSVACSNTPPQRVTCEGD